MYTKVAYLVLLRYFAERFRLIAFSIIYLFCVLRRYTFWDLLRGLVMYINIELADLIA